MTVQVLTHDPGIAFILSEHDRVRAADRLAEVDPFLGQWVGTREQEQQPGTSTRRYTHPEATYTVDLTVEARFSDGYVFRAAERINYSPKRDTLVGYWFEEDGTVQLFELDRSASERGRLVWQEICRTERLFRVEEVISPDDELTVSAFQQDQQGEFQLFAKSVYRRKRA